MLTYEEISSLINQMFWLIVKYKIIVLIVGGIAVFPRDFLRVTKEMLAENRRVLKEIKEAQAEINNRTDANPVKSNYKSTRIGFTTTTITDKKES